MAKEKEVWKELVSIANDIWIFSANSGLSSCLQKAEYDWNKEE